MNAKNLRYDANRMSAESTNVCTEGDMNTTMIKTDMLKHEAWSWEKNKKFELALLDVNEEEPDRWDKIATMVGGKSAKEVEEHYKALVQDVNHIESGLFSDDHDEHNEETVEPQIIQKLATPTPPLGLCLNIENEACLLEFLIYSNMDRWHEPS